MMPLSKELFVKDIMNSYVITAPEGITVREAAYKMSKDNVGALVVINEERREALGIITDRDIVLRVVASGKDPDKVLINEVMSSPIEAITPNSSINDAAEKMIKCRVKKLPVVDSNGNLVGIITYSNFLKAYPGYVDVLKELAAMKYSDVESSIEG